jgi:hypothetical protein
MGTAFQVFRAVCIAAWISIALTFVLVLIA